ncbi:MAG: methenyltetrahydromethanopterin cyclohydrolase, partial [Rubripirellula sp.]
LARGREKVLQDLKLSEQVDCVVGVLETEVLPTNSALQQIADQCKVQVDGLRIAIAPATSIAGSLQVVARSIETAMHKLHELQFDVGSVISATGHAPLPPPAKRGDVVGGIGRTNDAILYGSTVTLWVDHDDDAIADVIERVPSNASPDHGQTFAKVFKQYEYDFYKVDPLLFSPARVNIHNLRSGKSFGSGELSRDLLAESFGI